MRLRLEDDAVLGFFINFDLRMIGAHVALGAGAGKAGDPNRTGMTSVTVGAVADGAVGVGLAHAVTFLAAAGHGRSAFELDEGMWRTAGGGGLISFRKIYLLGREAFLAVDCGPGGSGVAAAQELLIDAVMAAAAVSSGQLGGDDEAVMILFFLAGSGLVALEAVDAFAGVRAHFVFVDDGVLRTGLAFGAFSAGPNKIGGRLFGFDLGPGAIEKEGSENQGERDDQSEEDRAKRHCATSWNERASPVGDERYLSGMGRSGSVACYRKLRKYQTTRMAPRRMAMTEIGRASCR